MKDPVENFSKTISLNSNNWRIAWINGIYAGGHEGSETPFDLDVTEAIKKGGRNLLVIRVLNPTYEPIDGIALKDTPSGAKQYPFTGNAAYNSGGIIGDVELLVVPAIRVELLTKRFENSIREVILRDRNHASLVMWGVLNENSDGIIFRKAVALLPSLRKLDPSRLFVLNSGRFDGIKEIGSMSNPGSLSWDVREDELKDWHPYVWMPYSSETLDLLSGRVNKHG